MYLIYRSCIRTVFSQLRQNIRYMKNLIFDIIFSRQLFASNWNLWSGFLRNFGVFFKILRLKFPKKVDHKQLIQILLHIRNFRILQCKEVPIFFHYTWNKVNTYLSLRWFFFESLIYKLWDFELALLMV